MHNKALVRHYTSYVNNFAVAMHTLERSIMKKTRFVQFLKEKYQISKTSLSLQGLLLKPIQRFPQYILFLTVSCHVGYTYYSGVLSVGGGQRMWSTYLIASLIVSSINIPII